MSEVDEWRCAVHDMTETDWAPFDDPITYNDTMSPDGFRYGER